MGTRSEVFRALCPHFRCPGSRPEVMAGQPRLPNPSTGLLLKGLLEIVDRGRIETSAQQGGELEPDQGLARAPAINNHTQIGFGPDQNSARSPVHRQHVPDVVVLELSKNSRQVLVQLTASDDPNGESESFSAMKPVPPLVKRRLHQ